MEADFTLSFGGHVESGTPGDRDVAAVVGPTNAEAIVGCLVAQRMARPWSGESPPGPRHLLHQSGYLDAVADDPAAAQAALTAARVTVVGVGGTGALVGQHLLGAGVRTFRLVDGDTVDESNLNPQYLFSPGDVGRRKVDADHAARHGAGRITSGVGIHRGHWGPAVQPGLTPCHGCVSEPRSLGAGPPPLPVVFGPVNSMVAAGVAAHAAWAMSRTRTAADLARTTVVDVQEPILRVLPARDRQPDCDVSHCRPRDKD